MSRERVLRRRLHSLRMLSEAVEAMRSLAAHHFRTARAALAPAREYRAGVDRALAGISLPPLPRDETRAGLLVVASDLGLCGAYNSSMAAAAVSEHAQCAAGMVFCVGRRILHALEQAGIPPENRYDAPVSVAGLTDLVLTLAQDLLGLYQTGRITTLDVISARFEGVGKVAPVRTPVLPLASPHLEPELRPSPYVSPGHLAAVAIREYLFITLYELLLDALASEHGVRLVSTEAARTWLERETTAAQRSLHAAQRETATQEVLDIAAGARLQLQRRSAR